MEKESARDLIGDVPETMLVPLYGRAVETQRADGIGVTICNAALVGLLARHWLRLPADIREGRAIANSGELERVIKPVSRRVMQYMIRVREAEVMVNKDVFEAFEHQRPYILYRAPYTGTLLSADRGEGSERSSQ
jgi:hypothetical protein